MGLVIMKCRDLQGQQLAGDVVVVQEEEGAVAREEVRSMALARIRILVIPCRVLERVRLAGVMESVGKGKRSEIGA